MVEDDDDHADLVMRNMTGRGRSDFFVVRARDAAEGIARKNEQDFDAVLLDLGLPDSNPDQTLRSFVEAFPLTPIVVLTSSADEGMVHKAISWGAQDLIEKSEFRGSLINRSLRYAVERKKTMLELERKNDELRGFAHTVAHELRTPLQSIVTALAIAKETSSEHVPDSLRQLLTIGFESSNHLSNLINDLLDFAQSANLNETHGTVDMDTLTRGVISEMQTADGADDSEIVIIDKLPTVEGEESRIRQVMRNLIGNAIKFRSEHPLTVEIEGKCSEDMCRVTVKDNGLGIAPVHLDRVFDPFFRVYTRDEIPGTGIGLRFSKEVVERLGGEIGVESVLGEGSTFWFTLPHAE